MTLKTATQLAIGGTASGLAISLFTQYFNRMVFRGSRPDADWITIIQLLFFLRIICFEGSLLLFFITLYRTRLQRAGNSNTSD